MDRKAVEDAAREILALIWRDQAKLFPLGAPKPMGMLRPELAAQVLGLAYVEVDGLGSWGEGRDTFEIAGMLDRQRELIAVSTKFEYPTRRFTGAHEVGHVALRHPRRVMHRDRPVYQIGTSARDRLEQEADYFAACFLAPARLLIQEFRKRFITSPLPLTDSVAFHLCGESSHALMRAGPDSHQFATSVASARSFNGQHFASLAEAFGISVGATAIRLRELRLLDE